MEVRNRPVNPEVAGSSPVEPAIHFQAHNGAETFRAVRVSGLARTLTLLLASR